MKTYYRTLSIDAVYRMKIYGGETVREHIEGSVWREICRVHRLDPQLPHTAYAHLPDADGVVRVDVEVDDV
jgi:hypothetical protein